MKRLLSSTFTLSWLSCFIYFLLAAAHRYMQAPIDFSTIGYNDFKILKKLGRGAQGRTYQVLLKVKNEDYAMKKVEYLADEDIQQAEQEIKQMKKLQSRFTVRFICAFQFDVDMCIIMEFCKQGDLRKVIAELQKLSEEERLMRVWAILSQIIRALDFMHSQDIVHRDIKPENIFVMEDGSVRLGDFGCAKEITEGGYATMAGTQLYLAAEVWKFKKTDFASDVFSVGVVTVELLTGKHPFDAGTEQGTIDNIKNGTSSQLPPSVSNEMKTLVTSMISHDANKRPNVKKIMQQDTIRMYLRLQEEKEKEVQKTNDAEAEIARLRAELAKRPAEQQSSKPKIVVEPLKVVAQQPKPVSTVPQSKPVTSQPKVQIVPTKPEPKTQIQTPKPNQVALQDSQVPGLISYTPLQSTCLEVVNIDGDIYTHTEENEDRSAILFDPLIKNGVTRFEVLNVKDLYSVGIAEENLRFSRGDMPWSKGKGRMVQYDLSGAIKHMTYSINGNKEFRNSGDRITLELNMDSNPRTLSFFKNDAEQPNYVTNIPPAVRVWAYLRDKGSQFKITKFERLSAPVAKHGEGSKAWKWGEDWKK